MLPPVARCGTAARVMFQGPPSRFIAASNIVSPSPLARACAGVNGICCNVRFGPAPPALLSSTSSRPN
jgi:hypothetical protein